MALTDAKGEDTNLTPDGELPPAPEADESDDKMTLDGLESEAVTLDDAEPTPEAPDKDDAPEAKPEATKPESDNRPARRDYDKYPEAIRPALKQMSNAAFSLYERTVAEKDAKIAEQAEALGEAGEGKTLPDNWYNDPAAALVTPEYKAIEVEFNRVQDQTHKMTQLMIDYKAERIKFNPQTGGFTANDDGTPKDAAIEQQLIDNRQQLYEKQKALADKGNGIVENFGKVYQSAEQQITESTKQLFPWLSDPKKEETKHYGELLKQWPKVRRGDPAVKFATALGIEHMKLKLAYQNLKKQVDGKTAARGDARRSAPDIRRNGGRVPAGGDGDKKMTLADFNT